MSLLAPTLQAFFTDRLVQQRHVSPATVASYRDTFRLLLSFAERHTGKAPCILDIADLDASLITAFLQHLEADRGNTARTRNARLGAVRSLFHYAAALHPEHAASIARVLNIPQKRFDKKTIAFLDEAEIDALIAAPDRETWEGRRDHALLLLTIQTGLRVSELIGLNCDDVNLATGAHLRCEGKGRKQRTVPLTPTTVAVLRVWLEERRGVASCPLFPTRTGRRLSRDAVEHRVTKHVAAAAERCPTLNTKKITPHVLRHTNAMQLLHAGVDTTVIALWLGHHDVRSTQAYLHADLTIKERALARTAPIGTEPGRYRPADPVLAFLESL
jgi:site-specific recombinase XerD